MASVARKAVVVDQQLVAMDLLETDRNGEVTLSDWNTVVSVIEEVLEDTQVIVYVPKKEEPIVLNSQLQWRMS